MLPEILKNLSRFFFTTAWLIGVSVAVGQNFEPTRESLSQYECPEWFRDAKFGIYSHWNAQSSVPSRANGWYARNMYEEGHKAYQDHVRDFGHPSEVGYKDVIEAWEVDNFDAEAWVELFKNAGAKYVVAMAVHHDNFDLWDSKHQPRWNSMNYGPKTDVVGDIRKATLNAGLRFGVTAHLGRTYSWFNTNKGADTEGPKAGVPYDGNDPAYADLYMPEKHDDIDRRHPVNPSEWWREHWKARMIDLLDKYQPDHFWFDGALPFNNDAGQAGMDVVAHYYNLNASLNGGKNEGVMLTKKFRGHGHYYPEVASLNFERSRSEEIREDPWQTDTSIGPWFYRSNPNYRSAEELIHELVDIVSKNGNMLLNIPPKGDGSFDEEAVALLQQMGNWLKANGEAIYGTRPWSIFGEGDLRFTTKENILYATALTWPDDNTVLITAASGWDPKAIRSVELLSGEPCQWVLKEEGLYVRPPTKPKDQHAHVIKITSDRPAIALSSQGAVAAKKEDGGEQMKKFGLDGDGIAKP